MNAHWFLTRIMNTELLVLIVIEAINLKLYTALHINRINHIDTLTESNHPGEIICVQLQKTLAIPLKEIGVIHLLVKTLSLNILNTIERT